MTTATPDTAKAFEEYVMGLDSVEAMTKAFNDSGDTGFKAKVKSYFEAAVQQKTKDSVDIAEQVKEFTQAALVDVFRQNGASKAGADYMANRLNQSALGGGKANGSRGLWNAAQYNPKSAGAKLDGKFEGIGEFIQTIWHHRISGKYRISGADAKAMDEKLAVVNSYSIEVPDAGGFLVPEEYRPQLLMLGLEDSIVLPRATVVPMNQQTLVLPTVDATSNATSVFGGVVVYRTEEGAEFVESQAKFGKVKLDVTKQTALAYLTERGDPGERARHPGRAGPDDALRDELLRGPGLPHRHRSRRAARRAQRLQPGPALDQCRVRPNRGHHRLGRTCFARTPGSFRSRSAVPSGSRARTPSWSWPPWRWRSAPVAPPSGSPTARDADADPAGPAGHHEREDPGHPR